jgi:hypothetical protein
MVAKLNAGVDASVEEKSTFEASNAKHLEYEQTFEADPQLERRVVWKLDALLVPLISLLFIFLFLDRANIGNARVAGLQKEIHATDTQYQLGKFKIRAPLPLA